MNGEIRGDSRELEWIFLDGWLGNELKKKKEGGGGKGYEFWTKYSRTGEDKSLRFSAKRGDIKKKIIADNINLYWKIYEIYMPSWRILFASIFAIFTY